MLRSKAIPNTRKITPINLPSLFSSTLLATRDPDMAPTTAAQPAINAALTITSLFKKCPIAPDPAIKNIIIREVPIAV